MHAGECMQGMHAVESMQGNPRRGIHAGESMQGNPRRGMFHWKKGQCVVHPKLPNKLVVIIGNTKTTSEGQKSPGCQKQLGG